METVRYTKVFSEDLDLGMGIKQVRLADGVTYPLHQISLGSLLQVVRRTLPSVAGASVLTAAGLLPAGARVFGVTCLVTQAFGTTGGLAGFRIGDSAMPDRWTRTPVALAYGTKTSGADFVDWSLPLYPAAADVLVTAAAGLFDATGQMDVAVQYALLVHPA